MEQELEERLDRIEKTVNDTNKMVAAMRRAQKKAGFFRLLYWLVIIVLAIASFYYVQPYISQFGAAYGIGNGTTGTQSSGSVINLIKQYQESQK